jgi:hypothetical protein
MYKQQTDVIYVGADVHQRETQLAIFEPEGNLLQENRIPTKDLASFVHFSSGKGKKPGSGIGGKFKAKFKELAVVKFVFKSHIPPMELSEDENSPLKKKLVFSF